MNKTETMFDFEKLDVYKKAYGLNQKLYRMIRTNNAMAPYIKNLLGRASFSTMLNIAEGSASFNKKIKKSFYIKARTAVFECASLISFLYDEGEISSEVKEALWDGCEAISRMLFIMINHLSGRFEWKEL